MNNRIKQARKKLNLTQKKFGENLNLSESHISNLEKGRVNLTARNIDDFKLLKKIKFMLIGIVGIKIRAR